MTTIPADALLAFVIGIAIGWAAMMLAIKKQEEHGDQWP